MVVAIGAIVAGSNILDCRVVSRGQPPVMRIWWVDAS
jgi:hypothetical protein